MVIARVGRGHQPFPPLLHPLHGPAQPHGQETEGNIFRIEDGLDAEAAADIGRDHPDAILGETEDLGQTMTGQMRYLGARPERELPLARAPLGDSPPPLERCRRLAIRAERALDHHGGFRQCLLHLAALEAAREEDIVGGAGVHDRAAPRADHVYRRRQRFSVHDHEGGGVLGSIPVCRHDGGHRLAGETRLGPGEHRLLGLDIARERRPGADPVPGDIGIGARGDGDHARPRRGRPRVHAPDPRMSVHAPHEGHVEHPRQLHVADVAPLPGHEPAVFLPGHARAKDTHVEYISQVP